MTPKSILTWLQAIKKQDGYEILLVQTIRNSLMGAGVIASTSLVAIIGVVSVGRAFTGTGAPLMQYGHWAINMSSMILALSLTEALLSLRTLAQAGFGSVFVNDASNKIRDELTDAEKYSLYLAGALTQLSRAAVSLSIGMAVAVIAGILFVW